MDGVRISRARSVRARDETRRTDRSRHTSRMRVVRKETGKSGQSCSARNDDDGSAHALSRLDAWSSKEKVSF
jgi:hypothetical protein